MQDDVVFPEYKRNVILIVNFAVFNHCYFQFQLVVDVKTLVTKVIRKYADTWDILTLYSLQIFVLLLC